MQSTETLKINKDQIKSVESYLKKSSFEENENPGNSIVFHFKKAGVTIIGYSSGSVVVQGKGWKVEDWADRINDFLNDGDDSDLQSEIGVIGCDEAGKGEFLGPLVLGSFFIPDEDCSKDLKKIGVKDSKKISDSKIKIIAKKLYVNYPDLVRVKQVVPNELNNKWEKSKNLSQVMADEYSYMLDNFCEDLFDSYGEKVRKIIVDQFTVKKERLPKDIKVICKDIPIEQTPKGERFLAVAAGSILARNSYLQWLDAKEKEYDIDFPRGYSDSTLAFGRTFIDRYGKEEFGTIAKTFFKTAAEI